VDFYFDLIDVDHFEVLLELMEKEFLVEALSMKLINQLENENVEIERDLIVVLIIELMMKAQMDYSNDSYRNHSKNLLLNVLESKIEIIHLDKLIKLKHKKKPATLRESD